MNLIGGVGSKTPYLSCGYMDFSLGACREPSGGVILT